MLLMRNPEQWTVRKFGFSKSIMCIGIDKKSHFDAIIKIPHRLYNKVLNDSVKVNYSCKGVGKNYEEYLFNVVFFFHKMKDEYKNCPKSE